MDILDVNKDLRQLLLESDDDVDQFLIKNYRYDSIDMLVHDLSQLNGQLNEELIELINQNFKQFIDLSSNLKHSEQMIQSMSVSLDGFNHLLARVIQKFDHVLALVEERRAVTESLEYYKFTIHSILLVNSLIGNLELLLSASGPESSEPVAPLTLDHIKLTVNLVLKIHNLIRVINHPVINTIKFRGLLREFEGYLKKYEPESSEHKFEVYKIMIILRSI